MADKKQKLQVLAYLRQQTQFCSLSDIRAQINDVPERTLRRWLVSWVESGLLERKGKGRATQYRLCEPSLALGFLANLDDDLKASLLNQIRDLWTHHSTALEGNTLTLGDTHFLLEEGLTISGKPLKDHQEVIGHGKAIELVYQGLQSSVSEVLLFQLHHAVQQELVTDIYKPTGDWKLEVNGTYAITPEGDQTFIQYASPADVPMLMTEWIKVVNNIDHSKITLDNAPSVYAKLHMGFVHIHPFWDGNGRMARLLANIPLLKAGLPPLMISQELRREYKSVLSAYQIAVGTLTSTRGVWPEVSQLMDFETFCAGAYQKTTTVVAAIEKIQKERDLNREATI
jgi:Fic family protein